MTSVRQPANTGTQERFDADDCVGSLEDVLDLARVVCNGEGDTGRASQDLADAVSEVREPDNREDVTFKAFTFDELYAVESALRESYYRLRLFLLENPHRHSARDDERAHLEAALVAMGLGDAIAREARVARAVFKKWHPTGREG